MAPYLVTAALQYTLLVALLLGAWRLSQTAVRALTPDPKG